MGALLSKFRTRTITFQGLCHQLRHATQEEVETLENLTSRGFDESLENEDPISMPVDIGRFHHLISLTLTHFQIESIPWSIIYLKQLRILDLSFNRISILPKHMGHLTSLETLNLKWNLLTAIPGCVLALPKLGRLDVEGNTDLISPPYSTCMKGVVEIKTYIASSLHKDEWMHSTLCYKSTDKTTVSQVNSLFDLCVEEIIGSNTDYLSPRYIPPRLKTFLLEKSDDNNGTAIQLAKCSLCRGYFSTKYNFETHRCRGHWSKMFRSGRPMVANPQPNGSKTRKPRMVPSKVRQVTVQMAGNSPRTVRHFSVQVAKCLDCGKWFSTTDLFNAHNCLDPTRSQED